VDFTHFDGEIHLWASPEKNMPPKKMAGGSFLEYNIIIHQITIQQTLTPINSTKFSQDPKG